MPFSSGRFTRDPCMDTNPSLILSWMPFSSAHFARGLCMDTSLKYLQIFLSQVPLFVWVWSLSTITNPHFFNKLSGSGLLLFFKGTLKSGDLLRLQRRLDRGSLCRASASSLGTDICMIRLLSVFFLLPFLSFSVFHFSCYVGQCLTLASSVHCQEVIKSVGMLCNILWCVGQYHKC